MKLTENRYEYFKKEYGILPAYKELAREKYIKSLQKLFKPLSFGNQVWDRNWEILVIIDACRYDIFNQMYGEDSDIESLESHQSVGSKSPEWIKKTFKSQLMGDEGKVAYVTGNPYSEKVNTSGVDVLDEVWRYAWDEETIHPKSIIDRGIKTYRNRNPDRLVLHLMQPHWPYRDDSSNGFNPDEKDSAPMETSFEKQRMGKISKQEHLDMYKDNLNYVMGEIKDKLLRGINCEEVVITSDHGEMFGEYGIYEHREYLPFENLRKVPWAITKSEKCGYVPDEVEDKNNGAVEERLEDLGYL